MSRYAFKIVGTATMAGYSIHTGIRNCHYTGDSMEHLRDIITSDQGMVPKDSCMDFFRRGDDKVHAYILNALCVYHDANLEPVEETAAIDFGREGCHEQNIRYYRDFLTYGRHRGQGHLFVGTLPTTPICEVAIALKLRGGIYYTDAFNRYDVLWTDIEMQLECTPAKQVLICNYTRDRLFMALAVPGETTIADDTLPPEFALRSGNR